MFALAISFLYFVFRFFNGEAVDLVVTSSATLLFWLLLLDTLIAVTVQALFVVSGIGTYKMFKKGIDEADEGLFDDEEDGFSFKKLFSKWKWFLPYLVFVEVQLVLLSVLSLIGATVLKQAYVTGWDVSRLVIGGLMVYIGVFGRGQINTQRIKQDKDKK